MRLWKITKWASEGRGLIERGYYLAGDLPNAIRHLKTDEFLRLQRAIGCCPGAFEGVLGRQLRTAVNLRMSSLGEFVLIQPTLILANSEQLIDSFLINLKRWVEEEDSPCVIVYPV